jgi:sec-independent protein translocase protein TatA
MLGAGSIAVIGAVALVLFGPKKLPELGKAAGKTLREFKNATKGIMDDEDDDKKDREEPKK